MALLYPELRHLTYFCRNPFKAVGCIAFLRTPKRTLKLFTHKARQIKYLIATKFCTPGAVQEVITPANFDEDRLRGFCVARGPILVFSVDLLRRH